MILDGLFGDTETVANRSIGQPAEDQSRDLGLAESIPFLVEIRSRLLGDPYAA